MQRSLSCLLALVWLGGCQAAPLIRPGISTDYPSAGKSDGVTLAIELSAPRSLLAATHHWVAADVFEYRLDLTERNTSGDFVPLASPLMVVCPQKGDGATNTATFSHLRLGQVYQVELEAWGDVGGTAADGRLNTQTRSLATFDFTSANDLEETPQATLHAVLDPDDVAPTAFIAIGPAEEAP